MALNAKGGSGRIDGESETFIAHSLRADGFDASEDGTGRGTPIIPILEAGARTGKSTDDPRAGIGIGKSDDPMFTLQNGKQHAVAIPIDMRQASRGATMTNNRAEGSTGGAPGTGIGQDGDPSPTIAASHVPAIAFDSKASGRNGFGVGDTSPTLRAMGHKKSHSNAGGQVAVAFDTTQITSKANYSNPKEGDPCHPIAASAHVPAVALAIRGRDGVPQIEMGDEVANAILTPNGGRGGVGVGATLHGMAVRRLTPRECERLQGFPDDWTAISHRGKPAADGPRYKALGNSMAVPVLKHIGERILEVFNKLP